MANRLAQAQSLYLRKHAENPIDWWPWCDQAIQQARQENKPIFLSIGYSSCHWCTVMEGEAFSDPTIADYMNTHFLPIKVDREERPDIDSIYMQALQLMTGQGGWPLNVFLSPDDLLPFYGGTYFPVEPKYGRAGFLQVLQALRRFYDQDGEKVSAVKTEILQHLQQAAALAGGAELPEALLQRGLEYSTGILASKNMGPSFPMMPYGMAALRKVRFQVNECSGESEAEFPSEFQYDAATVCRQRGLDLALGGICDHVGGGFHRYTVDPTWTVPHFEKMLYDNGQIVEFLADLWAMGMQEPAFQRAVEGTVNWLKREMTAPEGYFYAAQDADSFVTPADREPEEGAFYVWRYAELADLLSADALSELAEQFTITPNGNFEGQNVLQRRYPDRLSTEVESALERLFTARYGTAPTATPTFPPARNNAEAKSIAWPGRIPAVTDTKMIVAWNSLMISGLARAATVFQEPDYYRIAATAAQFILSHQWVNDRLHRLNYEGSPSVIAQAEDYALLIKAMLDLDQAALALPADSTVELNDVNLWRSRATQLQAELDQFLWSIDQGGYYNTDARADLVIRERGYEDNATPAANGIAAANLVRLFLLTEEVDYLDRAEQTLQAFSAVMQKTPQACPSLFGALDWFRHLTLVKTTPEMMQALGRQFLPTAEYRAEIDLPAEVIAFVCQGVSCQEPARSIDQLQQQLRDCCSQRAVG
ncbi:MAG: thioredoxin domain-containing protein [Elainella sp. Prado103]|nr:thioredoxin domain-containing protein [Elainella sp. Prado103]